MKIKQIYEIYSLTGGGYSKRRVHGYAWTKQDAEAQAARRRAHTGVIHVIHLNGNWHRVTVLPITDIVGDESASIDSRIALGDLPNRSIPAAFVRIGAEEPYRIGSDIVEEIDKIMAAPANASCCLDTSRIGGEPPVHFRVGDLVLSEALQAEVYGWLSTEIEYRKKETQ